MWNSICGDTDSRSIIVNFPLHDTYNFCLYRDWITLYVTTPKTQETDVVLKV